ncbi:hypothetical protein HSBAA_02040 [Vreelandella sulfidaeris]|uniref:CheR-type methyltransferase domain-containing protein n=1 Tax=Vreelandella sulfidaeris TaxID=115553 RepID=A0A455U319_9GAMM|nr:hypothetical protein HSBAA_02040 [Halomonas sulfidaeris]
MIYFDKDTQSKILKRFAPLMKPDGLLFAGHSENFSYISDAFKLRGQTVYTLAKKMNKCRVFMIALGAVAPAVAITHQASIAIGGVL